MFLREYVRTSLIPRGDCLYLRIGMISDRQNKRDRCDVCRAEDTKSQGGLSGFVGSGRVEDLEYSGINKIRETTQDRPRNARGRLALRTRRVRPWWRTRSGESQLDSRPIARHGVSCEVTWPVGIRQTHDQEQPVSVVRMLSRLVIRVASYSW